MSSIHEVATMAGVSTATVSKHINKTGYVSPEKRDAIDRAIRELNYSPNRSAKMLKTQTSSDILFIVPNMVEKLYRELAESTSLVLGNEYRVLIQLTNDDPVRESKILQDCLNNPCAGLLLVTCQPENQELLQKVQQKMPVIFLMREPRLEQCSFLGFNHFESIYSITLELLELGFFDIGLFTGDAAFSCEQECISAYRAAYQSQGVTVKEDRIFSVPFSKEVTFLKIMPLFDSGRVPQAFICTSQMAARAISEVAFFRNMSVGHELLIFALGEDSWYDSIFSSRIICTYRDVRKLGSLAAQALLSCIQSPRVYEPVNMKLSDSFAFEQLDNFIVRLSKNLPYKPPAVPKKKLRILFNRVGSGADSLKSLLPQYTQMSHVEVELETMSHDALQDLLISNDMSAVSSDYDLLSVDAPWVSYLASIGAIVDLTNLMKDTDIPARIDPLVLENVGTRQGRIYGLPYTHSHQLLFYRKDLFEDPDISAAFYEKYHVKLEPPKDWNMYNIISAFFTQSMNPDSPVPYGSSILGGSAPAMCTELYPRIWSYNGCVIDQRGYVRLYSPENKKAYQSFLDTLKCTPSNARDFYVQDGLKLLMDGQIAMCIAFTNTASILVTHASGFLSNSIGFAPIPRQKPVVAGWNICINAKSKHIEEAWDFIQWFSSMEISAAYTILGGSSPVNVLLEQESLAQLYPWNAMASREYRTAIHRDVPILPNARILDQVMVENILWSVVDACLNAQMSLDEALLKAHKELCAYAEANGYPKNVLPLFAQ